MTETVSWFSSVTVGKPRNSEVGKFGNRRPLGNIWKWGQWVLFGIQENLCESWNWQMSRTARTRKMAKLLKRTKPSLRLRYRSPAKSVELSVAAERRNGASCEVGYLEMSGAGGLKVSGLAACCPMGETGPSDGKR